MTNARTKSASLVRASHKSPIRARIWPSWCAHHRNCPSEHGYGPPGARIAEIAHSSTYLGLLVRAPLAEVAEDDPVGGVVGEITDDKDHKNC